MMKITTLLLTLTLFMTGLAAQPINHTINFINTGPPGGSADVFMDIYTPCLTSNNIRVVKLFKPGADGLVALKFLLDSTDTENTTNVVTGGVGMLQTNNFPNINTQLVLQPMIYTGKMDTVLLSKTGKFNSIAEVRAASQVRPLNVGVAGGLLPYISKEWLDHMRINYTYVPYKTTAQGQIDLIGENIDLAFSMFIDSASLVKASKLQILTSSMSPAVATKYGHKNIDTYIDSSAINSKLLPTGSLLTVKRGASKKSIDLIRGAISSCNRNSDIISKLAMYDTEPINLTTEEIEKIIAIYKRTTP